MARIKVNRIQITVNFGDDPVPDYTVRARLPGDSTGKYFRSEAGCDSERVKFLKTTLQKMIDGYCTFPVIEFDTDGFKLL